MELLIMHSPKTAQDILLDRVRDQQSILDPDETDFALEDPWWNAAPPEIPADLAASILGLDNYE